MESDGGLNLNLTDEVELSCRAFIKDALRQSEMIDNCSLDGEFPDPFAIVLRQLEFVSEKVIPDAVEWATKLQNHEHKADDNGFCDYCGRDLNV